MQLLYANMWHVSNVYLGDEKQIMTNSVNRRNDGPPPVLDVCNLLFVQKVFRILIPRYGHVCFFVLSADLFIKHYSTALNEI